MQILRPRQIDELSDCPYLPGRQRQFEYFWAVDLSEVELGELLAQGWRKFGPYFFRPICPGCHECIPVRIVVDDFAPSRSQKRILRKNRDLEVSFGPLSFTDRAFEIYSRHAEARFDQSSDLEDFLTAFYLPSCPALQIDVRLEGTLIGVGFLDRADNALSSVYFCFDPQHSGRNLGTFSILQEIEEARRLGLAYHYLGYFVPGCDRMLYKDHFRPREHYDWRDQTWKRVTTPPGAIRENEKGPA